MREGLLTRLKGIFGVSDKVLNMVFAEFLLGAGRRASRWAEVGGSMIAIDTLVHNFLQRTGTSCSEPASWRVPAVSICMALRATNPMDAPIWFG